MKRAISFLERLLAEGRAGGYAVMLAAALALVAANSPWAEIYGQMQAARVAGVGVLAAVNDGLMVLFFLLVGAELKRELVEGELARPAARLLPGAAALAGMVVPALVYLLVAGGDPVVGRGWAASSATDIAFALAVLGMAGRVPVGLRAFLLALAILDDLGAIVVIGLFYSHGGELAALVGVVGCALLLVGLNRAGVRALAPYVLVGLGMWFLMLLSGVHATLAGVILGLSLPLGEDGPLHRVEHGLAPWVMLGVLPVFGFFNSGVAVDVAQVGLVTAAVFAGLVVGKPLGIFSAVWLLVRLRLARLPQGANGWAMLGVGCLGGIGFTMSLFIGILAFGHEPEVLAQMKLGVLAASVVSALAGLGFLRVAARG